MDKSDLTATYVFDAPPHIWGMHARAIRKHRQAYRAWKRTWYPGTRHGRRWCFCRNARLARRAAIWDQRVADWHDALQVIVPYFRRA